jgi:peptide/nickel transport system permease protein
VIHRIGLLLVTVLAAALLSSALARVAPGLGMDERQLDLHRSEASIQALRQSAPGLFAGFCGYVAGLVRGEWGDSISLQRPVRELVAERAAVTLRSLAGGLVLAWSAALGMSLALAALRSRMFDLAVRTLSGVLLCVPAAVIALFLLYVNGGATLAIAAILYPRLFRYLHNLLADTGRRPHVLAARARGIHGFGLLWRHLCIPAGAELVALAGISASMVIAAAIPAEVLCDSPGLGQLVWQSALARDVPLLMHLTVLVALATGVANMAADTARALTPRGL